MAKKILAVNLLVEESLVNKALAVLDQEVLPADELNKQYFDRKPVIYDVSALGDDAFSMVVAFTAIIAGAAEDEKGGSQ